MDEKLVTRGWVRGARVATEKLSTGRGRARAPSPHKPWETNLLLIHEIIAFMLAVYFFSSRSVHFYRHEMF